MSVKAIETSYKGYRFRSRLEARWAVFFDAMGIEWEYEKEGFDLDGLLYLPDFWLPHFKLWAEVKPITPNAEETEKARRLVATTGYACLMLEGPPDYREYTIIGRGEDVGATYALISEWFSEHRFGGVMCFSHPTDYGDDYIAAVEAARSARFEHGEQPVTVQRRAAAPEPIQADWYGHDQYLIGLIGSLTLTGLDEVDGYLVRQGIAPLSEDDFSDRPIRGMWRTLRDGIPLDGIPRYRHIAEETARRLSLAPMTPDQRKREILLAVVRGREESIRARMMDAEARQVSAIGQPDILDQLTVEVHGLSVALLQLRQIKEAALRAAHTERLT